MCTATCFVKLQIFSELVIAAMITVAIALNFSDRNWRMVGLAVHDQPVKFQATTFIAVDLLYKPTNLTVLFASVWAAMHHWRFGLYQAMATRELKLM